MKIDTWLKVFYSPSPKHQTELSKPSKVHATGKQQKNLDKSIYKLEVNLNYKTRLRHEFEKSGTLLTTLQS